MLVLWLVTGVGVPSTRAQAPTRLFQPMMEYKTQASCLISESSSTMDSLMRAPAPTVTRGPTETLGPSLAVGSTVALGWMKTGGMMLALGLASSLEPLCQAFCR